MIIEVEGRINESALRSFKHTERTHNSKAAKRVEEGEFLGSRLIGKPLKKMN